MEADREELWERLRAADRDLAEARDDEDHERVAWALLGRGRALLGLGENADVLATADDLLGLIADDGSHDDAAATLEVQALILRASALSGLGRPRAAEADLGTLASAYGSADRPELRRLVTGGLQLRITVLAQARRDRDLIRAARDLMARTELDAGEPVADRARAVTLAAWADAARRQGDLTAAVAARRRLIAELWGVQVEGRPAFVFDQRRKLAEDLSRDGQPLEAVWISDDLVRDLTDAELPQRERRLAVAMRVQAVAVGDAGDLDRFVQITEEIHRRFARSDEVGARAAAGTAVITAIPLLFRNGQLARGRTATRQALALFDTEAHDDLVTALGQQLQEITRMLAKGRLPWRRNLLIGAIGASIAATRQVLGARRAQALSDWLTSERDDGWRGDAHWMTTARWVVQLQCAMTICDRLEARFTGDQDPRRVAICVTVPLSRAAIYARQARVLAATAALRGFLGMGAAAIAAVVDHARPTGSGQFRETDWIAAVLGTTVPLQAAPDPDRTRGAIRQILQAQRFNPAMDRFLRRQLRTFGSQPA